VASRKWQNVAVTAVALVNVASGKKQISQCLWVFSVRSTVAKRGEKKKLAVTAKRHTTMISPPILSSSFESVTFYRYISSSCLLTYEDGGPVYDRNACSRLPRRAEHAATPPCSDATSGRRSGNTASFSSAVSEAQDYEESAACAIFIQGALCTEWSVSFSICTTSVH